MLASSMQKAMKMIFTAGSGLFTVLHGSTDQDKATWLARFAFPCSCSIISCVRLTLTLGVHLHLILFKERQRHGRSWDGMADIEQPVYGKAQHLSFGASSAGAVCLPKTSEALPEPSQSCNSLIFFDLIDGREP